MFSLSCLFLEVVNPFRCRHFVSILGTNYLFKSLDYQKREVYKFLAMVNPIQNYVSYIMKKPGSETGTSKAKARLKLVKPATQPYHQGPGFLPPPPSLHSPAHCAGFTKLVSLMVLKWVIHIDGRKGRNFWNCSRRGELSQRPPSNLPCFWLRTGWVMVQFCLQYWGWINP